MTQPQTADHPFKDEWAFQRTMSKPYPGNSVAGQPIAPNQPCFTCDVPFADHAQPRTAAALSAEERRKAIDDLYAVFAPDVVLEAEVEAILARIVALDAARAAPSPDTGALDVERLGFTDLLDVAEAILTHYPPDSIVCSHSVKADIGAQTIAGIADVVASCRASLAGPGSGLCDVTMQNGWTCTRLPNHEGAHQ